MREVVITGMGAIGPFGTSPDALWDALCAPETSLAMDAVAQDAQGVVRDFEISRFTKSARVSRAPKVSQYAMAAASTAIAQSELTLKSIDKDSVSIVYGTASEPTDVVERNFDLLCSSGLNAIEPIGFQESVYNAPASLISIEYGFRGPLLALPMGWASGGYALCAAADLVATGQADVVISIASEAAAKVGRDIDKKLRFVSPNDGKEARVRPFDKRANGTLASEGSAALVIEAKDAALARRAYILADLKGWASTNDAQGVVPKSGFSKGIANAMRMADAYGAGADVVFGGSYCTKDAEAAEAHAVHAYVNGRALPAITNIRGAVGDCKGVSGLWNVIAAIKVMEHGAVPLPIGCEQPDDSLGLRLPSADDAAPTRVMCNNFWVSGLNTSAYLEVSR